jgi:hypothetical protein
MPCWVQMTLVLAVGRCIQSHPFSKSSTGMAQVDGKIWVVESKDNSGYALSPTL